MVKKRKKMSRKIATILTIAFLPLSFLTILIVAVIFGPQWLLLLWLVLCFGAWGLRLVWKALERDDHT